MDTTNVSLYEALKSVIEWTGQARNEEMGLGSGLGSVLGGYSRA